jgi:hypothetical protein
MELLIALGAILGAILIGAISPGPIFVLVAPTAIAVGPGLPGCRPRWGCAWAASYSLASH